MCAPRPAYAEVALPLPVEHAFTYSIPPELDLPVVAGMRVIAPLGVRTLAGVVVARTDTPSVEESRVKPLTDVIDLEPSFSQELLNLCRWVGDYYLSSWGEALGAATPGGVRVLSRRRVRLTEAPSREVVQSLGRRAPVQGAILQALRLSDGQTVGRLQSALGDSAIYGPLAALELAGLVTVVSELRRGHRPRRIRAARLAEPPSKTAEQLAAMRRAAPKQAAVLEYLCRVDEVMPIRTIMREAEAGDAAVRALIGKGLLVLEEVEAERLPPMELGSRELHFSAEPLTLNSHQAPAYAAIRDAVDASRHETFLLYGVTGSGKTEVYMHAIQHVLDRGRSALVLVPEIALTPQTAGRFAARFGPRVAVLHSRLSPGERYDEWTRIRTGDADIVVGARSAVFAPLSHVGIIVLDEEHETSYKQEEPNPRYHARDVARERARMAGVPLVLGSATPSLEAMHSARSGASRLLRLPARVQNRPMPEVLVVDMRAEIEQKNFTMFSGPLSEAIDERMVRHEQVLLLLNRRGFATYVFCRDCGHVEVCENCNISLTHHRTQNVLVCHYCGHVAPSPTVCDKCGGHRIKHQGRGTQRVEEECRRRFPPARILRMDADTTSRKGSHQRILEAFRDGEVDILVGTQMIAKGLDFPNVTLVGIVLGDTALHFPDFRAAERTFNLLTQVAGRSGRGELGGEVVLQTYQPDHYSIVAAKGHDYEAFMERELQEREEFGYPPFRHILRLLMRGESRQNTSQVARDLAAHIKADVSASDVTIKGPASPHLTRLRGEYRWHVVLFGDEPDRLRDVARRALDATRHETSVRHVTIVADMDPISLL